MITAVVGRTFLEAYNSKYKKQLTPKKVMKTIMYSCSILYLI